ncbi:hypothetical protein CVT26_002097 [Gymnopilus dilepis]|uniref:Uncharacterized protein n=1 Tax=Gymnopilus dilepis TaxID=231916 RepID=A0A409VEH7_9AGAR|nr:hypothetical protein CVT26_002097 [Gymnopilus dilepis]
MDQFNCPGLHYDYDLNNLASYNVQPNHPLATHVPLHAPVPLPIHVPLLYSGFQVDATDSSYDAIHYDLDQQSPGSDDSMTACDPQNDELDFKQQRTLGSLQPTFPTPSELLAELASKDMSSGNDGLASDPRPESASKARRRAMAKSVGFVPTDPDTISSHEKKRHYLESLEQYIIYLHQQFELIGATPPPLTRVNNYRGLTSKSIRTLLVHMENTTRSLNSRTRADEQKFLRLRDQVMLLDHSYC